MHSAAVAPASTMSLVVPAISVTIARSVPLSAFSRLDFPTLGRPTSATCARHSSLPYNQLMPNSDSPRRSKQPPAMMLAL